MIIQWLKSSALRLGTAVVRFTKKIIIPQRSVGIDEFNGKPSGTMNAAERMRFATFGFYEVFVEIIHRGIAYLGKKTEHVSLISNSAVHALSHKHSMEHLAKVDDTNG